MLRLMIDERLMFPLKLFCVQRNTRLRSSVVPDGRVTPISLSGHRRKSVPSIFRVEEPLRVSGGIHIVFIKVYYIYFQYLYVISACLCV